MTMHAVEVRGLTKRYGSNRAVAALDNVDLVVERGEFVVLLGPSGSGKTTLLRCIAGLEWADEGELSILGQTVFSGSTSVPPEKRDIGMVFQSYAIWPHMTVLQNVSLALLKGRRRLPKAEAKERALAALQLMGIGHLADRSATMVSGGQQQRIALARAVAVEPGLLLMDEPLSNLDALLREQIRGEIRLLAKRLNTTIIYVTHDRVEAMALADKIVVLGEGRVLQVGDAESVYNRPATRHMADFLGGVNWLPGRLDAAGARHFDTPIGPLGGVEHSLAPGDEAVLGIRPEDIVVGGAECAGTPGFLEATVADVSYLGEYYLYRLTRQGVEITAKTLSRVAQSGTVWINLPPEKIMVFDDDQAGGDGGTPSPRAAADAAGPPLAPTAAPT
jgi:ABC-type Fe3+/spermidine/putrescine transport system ATPase subunit